MAPTLIEQLALAPAGKDRFTGTTPSLGGGRIFGGAAVAHALLAAYETVSDRACHSLHAYFIHPGNPATPVTFEVERSRDGGSFATRRVRAMQDGRPILDLMASFQARGPGMEHQMAMPVALDPEALVDDDRRGASVGIQLRNAELPRPGFVPDVRAPHHQMWFRSEWPLGLELRYHQAALAYASDFPQLPVIVQPHPVTWAMDDFQFASLDHAIWFHRPLDFHQWHLCDLDTPSSAQGRGLSRSSIYAQDGTLVATVLQEAMIRMRQT